MRLMHRLKQKLSEIQTEEQGNQFLLDEVVIPKCILKYDNSNATTIQNLKFFGILPLKVWISRNYVACLSRLKMLTTHGFLSKQLLGFQLFYSPTFHFWQERHFTNVELRQNLEYYIGKSKIKDDWKVISSIQMHLSKQTLLCCIPENTTTIPFVRKVTNNNKTCVCFVKIKYVVQSTITLGCQLDCIFQLVQQ